MSDRICLRGCTQDGEHYASCAWFGIDEALKPAIAALPNAPKVCKGCAPAEARDRAMVCDRCYRRLRRHITDAPDLVGRLRSLADPTSAKVYDQARGGGAHITAPAPVPADLIDAAEAVMRTLRTWAVYVDPRSGVIGGMPAGAGAASAFEYAHECSNVILSGLDTIVNNAADVIALSEAVLVSHPVDDHGERESWSIVDAVARYRLERPDFAEVVPGDDEDVVEMAKFGIPEWGDRLIPRRDALRRAALGTDRPAVSEATLRRWIAEGVLAPRATTRGALGQVTWFRTSDVDRAAKEMRGRTGGARTKGKTNA